MIHAFTSHVLILQLWNVQQMIVLFFAVAVPVLLLVLAVLFSLRISKRQALFNQTLHPLIDALEAFPKRSMEHREACAALFAQTEDHAYMAAFDALCQESDERYAGRWLPKLSDILHEQALLQAVDLHASRYDIAAHLFSSGLLASAVTLLLIHSFDLSLSQQLAFLPLVLALITGLHLALKSQAFRQSSKEGIQHLRLALAKVLPVYDPASGTALLIDQMLLHDHAMQASVDRFNATARHLADSEFSEGIAQSVRQVMGEEIAPPIRESAQRLSDLAVHLEQRQSQSMDALAGKFAGHLAQTIGLHLSPVTKELQVFNQMMHETRQFINDSVAILQTSRDQNISLNQELRDALKRMHEAKQDMAEEMTAIESHMALLSQSSEKLSEAYTGESQTLGTRIHELRSALDHSLEVLGRGLQGSSEALELAGRLRTDAEGQNRSLTEELGRIVDALSKTGNSLRESSAHFSKESSSYVNQSLASFDHGLSEVVERLIFTASAIRDAVDTLPLALRQSIDEQDRS